MLVCFTIYFVSYLDFKSPDETVPVHNRMVDLRKCTLHSSEHKLGSYCFLINVDLDGKETYAFRLFTKNEEDKNLWMNVLGQSCSLE